MSKWQIPYPQEVKVAGYMDSEEPIYFQNMTMKQSEERLKKKEDQYQLYLDEINK